MRALTVANGLHVETLPDPLPAGGEALIAVRLAGICATDIEITRGYAGFQGVLGHEFVGAVVDNAPSELLGQRVCGEINVGCGLCSWCARGLSGHCPHRTALGIRGRNGAFADLLTLPIANLHPVPADMPDETAVFAEPLAAALEILEQIHIPPGCEILVVGDGKLGLLCAQVLALAGTRVLALGRYPDKLAILSRRGIQTTLKPPDRRFPLVVEATGSAGGFATARECVEPRGTLVLKSTFAGATTLDMASLVVDEVRLIGSRCGPFPPALALLARDAVDVRSLIEATYPLAEAKAAFDHAARRGALKILLHMGVTNP